jgi:hypothetical protein
MFHVDVSRSGITKDSATTKLTAAGFTASSVKEAATDTGLQLVTENTVSRLKLALFQRSNHRRILGLDGSVIRASDLLSILAGFTFGLLNLGDVNA